MPALTCECEDFKVGMPQIIAATSPDTHSWRMGYTGKPFKFCPWCQKVLLIEEKEKE